MTLPTSPNTLYVPSRSSMALTAPILSSPPRRMPQSLERRSRVHRRPSARKYFEVLPELSEVDESSYETEEYQSDAGSTSSDPERRRRRPRPIGITQASDLVSSNKLSVMEPNNKHLVLIRSPPSVAVSEESATLSFIARFDDDEDGNNDVYRLEFPRPPSTVSRGSPTPSLESFTSGSSASPLTSRDASPTFCSNPLPDFPATPSPLETKRWNDGLDELWSQLDELLEWDPNATHFSLSSPAWDALPETPPPPISLLTPSPSAEKGHKRYPSSQLDPKFPGKPERTVPAAFRVPSYPPPPPPTEQKQPQLPVAPQINRPPPKTPLPVDVEFSLSPTDTNTFSPSSHLASRFSVSTVESPVFQLSLSPSRLSRSRSRSSYSSESSASCSTCSHTSGSSSESRGTRRKPIPIELFIR